MKIEITPVPSVIVDAADLAALHRTLRELRDYIDAASPGADPLAESALRSMRGLVRSAIARTERMA